MQVRAGSNNADVTVAAGDRPRARTLSFTPSTWSTARTVAVSGLHVPTRPHTAYSNTEMSLKGSVLKG